MRRTLLFLLLLSALPLVAAHQGGPEQIDEATRAIERDPGNAMLYVKRGEQYRILRLWQEAERDYLRARELDADLYTAQLAMGRMLQESGRAAESLPWLTRYTRIQPQDRVGHEVYARTLVMLGRTADAIGEFERAVAPDSDPELVLEYTAALAAAGRRTEALAVLDRRGAVINYQLAAIEIERNAGHLDAALRRIVRAEAAASRKEEWMMRRGDLLLQMGREEEARAAYQKALEEIGNLPAERRRSRAVAAMKKRLREK